MPPRRQGFDGRAHTCGWDRIARGSGIIYGEVFLAAPPMFRLFESGIVPPCRR